MRNRGQRRGTLAYYAPYRWLQNAEKPVKTLQTNHYYTSVLGVKKATFCNSDEGTYAFYCRLGGKIDFELGDAKYILFLQKNEGECKNRGSQTRDFTNICSWN